MEHEPQLITPADAGWTIPAGELVKMAKALAASVRHRPRMVWPPLPGPDGWIAVPRYMRGEQA